ncbi:PREDICTED: protein RCC2 homolog isoform X1 [Nelumbo nucifera]|uniref:Protein RCC2 homolog isoform X1 n=1 Tax=Nelumbo nucifera TaxID=4432 RepID=A0A1U8AB07_NELNU|nr:PREDICTED: protein RCC2 homolog isoform X1 [Nelumbo nucifera]
MSVAEAEKKPEEEKVVKSGELLFCGGTNWDSIGRKGTPADGNLVSPTRLRPLVGIDICFVASGCTSCHCVALDVEGRCYTWGRNEKGQLGHGDMLQRDRPTVVSDLSKYKIIKAGAGRSHTVVVTEDGSSFSFGWNKHGQLGSGSIKNEFEPSPVRCLVSEVTNAVCGGDFTVWLSSLQGSSILTAGLPQYGQLGHGTDNEYNAKESSVKLAYEPQPRPRAIASLAGETIVKVACGTNHTVAVDSKGFVYTWGFGGYGRLGHREQKDEWIPRRVEVFQRQNVLPPDAVVSAGSVSSACTAGGGQLYMWGKIKNTGDDWMYPKPVMDLSGWHIRCMDSGSMHHFCGADDSCISWGYAHCGELGYGPTGPKSSAIPKKVDILEGMHVIGVSCGLGHSMVIVDRTNVGDRLEELNVYDGKASSEVLLQEVVSLRAQVQLLRKLLRRVTVELLQTLRKGRSLRIHQIHQMRMQTMMTVKAVRWMQMAKQKRRENGVEKLLVDPKVGALKDLQQIRKAQVVAGEGLLLMRRKALSEVEGRAKLGKEGGPASDDIFSNFKSEICFPMDRRIYYFLHWLLSDFSIPFIPL